MRTQQAHHIDAATLIAKQHFDVIVIGGGQTGLSVGYHLKRRGVSFVILDAAARVGDAWRKRWDSLRLFTPAWLSSLDGLPFPAPRHHFPTKDEMAEYLEQYAAHFALPVCSSTRVERLTQKDGRFVVQAGGLELSADQVIIAMATYQTKRVPGFASELRSDIVQLHSTDYKNPGQLRPGSVAIVGCGNSGAEIARELSATHRVILAANDVGQVPFRMDSWFGRWIFQGFLMRIIFHRLLTIHTSIGRKARPKMMHKATPLIRAKLPELLKAGVRQLGRVVGVVDGLPITADGEKLAVDNVIWCTGYGAGQAWIDLPIFDEQGEPLHEAGIVTREPGLFFVGLPFMTAMSSSMIHGVGRDADRIAGLVAERAAHGRPVARAQLKPNLAASAQ